MRRDPNHAVRRAFTAVARRMVERAACVATVDPSTGTRICFEHDVRLKRWCCRDAPYCRTERRRRAACRACCLTAVKGVGIARRCDTLLDANVIVRGVARFWRLPLRDVTGRKLFLPGMTCAHLMAYQAAEKIGAGRRRDPQLSSGVQNGVTG